VKLFWNLDTNSLVATLGSTVVISDLEFKRRDGVSLEILFFRGVAEGGVLEEMPATTEIRFAIKTAIGGTLLVSSAAFAEDSNGWWVANPSFNTTALDTAFTANPGSIAVLGELTRRDDVGEPWSSTQTLNVTIINDLIVGDEGTPTNATDPTDYLTAVQNEARYVRYDASQSLDSTEKTQARTNIGAINQDIQQFTSNGTWTNPSPLTAKLVDVIMIGGGGGGGSGRKGAVDSASGGGGGGGAGAVVHFQSLTTILATTLSAVVGSGGTGGAAVTVDDSNGNAGTDGGDTTFNSYTAAGGDGGAGGTTSGGAGGAAKTNANLIGGTLSNSLAGADGGAGSAATAASNSESYNPTGGGGGGGVTSGNLPTDQSTGGGMGNSIIRLLAGSTGEGDSFLLHGTGGGGSASALTDSIANSAGDGGLYGGGGGGGGAGQNDTGGGGSSGAGGAGAGGIAIIITHL